MIYTLTLLICFIFVLLELAGVKWITSRFLAITPFFLLFVMMGFNRMNNDYLGYQWMFYDLNPEVEFGYDYLIKILKAFGRDHDTIIFIAGALLVFTIHRMLKNSRHVNLVIFLYCCFPLVYDINQTRNLIMYLIVTLSLLFVEKGKPVKFYLSILLAFSIHRLALIYAPFYYLARKKSRTQFIKLMWKLFFIFAIASPFIIKLASKLFPSKMGFYLQIKPDLGMVIMITYTVLDIFTVWWVDKKIRHKLDDNESKKLEVLYRFVWFSLLALPFTAYTFELKRVQRNVLLAKFIYCAIAMKYLTMKQRLFTLLLLSASVIAPILLMVYNDQMFLFDYLKENSVIYYFRRYFF